MTIAAHDRYPDFAGQGESSYPKPDANAGPREPFLFGEVGRGMFAERGSAIDVGEQLRLLDQALGVCKPIGHFNDAGDAMVPGDLIVIERPADLAPTHGEFLVRKQ